MMTQIKTASAHGFAHGVILARADALRAGKQGKPRVSGYVEVGKIHFHVAVTSEGPLVSQVQWADAKNDEAAHQRQIQPMHNFFVVTAEQKSLVLEAWSAKLHLEHRSKEEDLKQTTGMQVKPLNSMADLDSESSPAPAHKVGSGRAR